MYGLNLKMGCVLKGVINLYLRRFAIKNLWREIFYLAQVGYMSEGTRLTEDRTSGEQYENVTSLCNDVPGDGPKFKKRGLGIMLLGKCDYEKISKEVLLLWYLKYNPYPASHELIAPIVAAWKWNDLGLNAIAEKVWKDPNNVIAYFDETTRILTGGTMEGKLERREWLMKIFYTVFRKCDLDQARRSAGILKCDNPADPFCGLHCPVFDDPNECDQF